MDVKTILQNPEAAIEARWGSNCPKRRDILMRVETLQMLRSHIKRTKEEKGALAAQFKHAKDDPSRFEELKAAMARVSRELGEQEQKRKEAETELRALFHSGAEASPKYPQRFCDPAPENTGAKVAKVSSVEDDSATDWDAYVSKNQRASLYHAYVWKRVVERAFGHSCHYYAARDAEGRILGVLPLVSMKSRLFGSYAVSLPFFNYGGPLADSREVTQALFEAAGAEAKRQGWQHIEYRCCDTGLDMPSSNRKASMILVLPDSQAALDRGLGAKVRAQYKQAQRHQPEVRFGGGELLEDFYRVFSRNMRDLGTPVYAKTFFETILDELGDCCTLVCVYLDSTPVGSAFLLAYRDMLEIPWASTLREYNAHNVNMWMYRQILGFAIDKAYPYFDFGRSTVGGGTYHFKKQWGAEPLEHHWYYQLATDYLPAQASKQALPQINPDNPKYRLAIAAWKRLPLFVANSLGPHIVKNLP